MKRDLFKHIWLTTLLISVTTLCVQALSLNHFATNSRLAQGHWVKISITESGVYEITREELARMGFNNPQLVQVFGYGGKMLSETLNNDLPDDLQQIPVLHRQDKICFYATGAVDMQLVGGEAPHFTRQRNTYSQHGFYFLTQGQGQIATFATREHTQTTTQAINTSLDAVLHEEELVSPGLTGAELMGEDILMNQKPFQFQLRHPSDTRIGLTSRLAVRGTMRLDKVYSTFSRFACMAHVNGQSVAVPYSSTATKINGCTSAYTFYQINPNPDNNMVWFDLPGSAENGTLTYTVSEITSPDSMVIQMARLDYFIITYFRHNVLEQDYGNQCRMSFTSNNSNDAVSVQGAGDIVVWDVTTATAPTQMLTRADGDLATFTPGASNTPRKFVAFSPSKTLLKINGSETIENQNLHAMSTPDMLIVTNKEFLPQAERLAQMHHSQDGLECAVIDQEQIYNEFSSGTPSAMAVRLLCKMLYDRDQTKFKNLLLFGNISFDNRGIVTGKQNRVICYVSENGNSEDNSYLNDDFFGYLYDNSGRSLSSDKLCIGIGHFPVANTTEAESALDKLYEYMITPDYGAWRNNYSIWSDDSRIKKEGQIVYNGDTIYQLHESQATGIGTIIDTDCGTQMIRDMAYVRMFPRNVTQTYLEDKYRTSTEAKRHIHEMLSDGQYFITYVGHAGATSFTSTSMWTASDVQNTTYKHLPIMTTACCDVARIDSDHRGIAEQMFHKRDGGAIALYTTTRQVYAAQNDDTNRTFVEAMFNRNNTGEFARIGDAYVASKNSKNTTNKFNWVLLGDPALKLNYPKPFFKIKQINGVDVTNGRTINLYPLQKVNIVAEVMNENVTDQVNTSFNGDATITIYDTERTYLAAIQATGKHTGYTTLNYPREKLAQVNGRVVNGIFNGSIIMPRYSQNNGQMRISVFAHQDDTDNMVNGLYDNIRKQNYSSNNAVSDHINPVIDAMYLNNENEFASNNYVGTEATLYIRATDNTAFNTQQLGLGNNMRLTLDGGKNSFNIVKNHATVTDEGRTMNISYPLSELTPGQHTLDFTVMDVCGNSASQSISFIVSGNDDITLTTSEIASSTAVDINLSEANLVNTPTVDIKVTDLSGNLIWSKTTDTFPCTWNLTDLSGQRVKSGIYRIYGNYMSEGYYGGSNLIDFVVLSPLGN